MTLLNSLKELRIDLSSVGIIFRANNEPYYCTPENADIIGWAGVDGIHYCTIPHFGEMIFAVSPMNFGDCVHPIAYSFHDLLGLLLSCGDMAAIEQCYAWDQEQYNAFLQDCLITKEQQDVLDRIKWELKIKPIKNVFKYIKTLQEEFDYSAIPYADDYYDPDMNPHTPLYDKEWSVTFAGGFWSEQGTPGEEVKLNKLFAWSDEKWNALSAYICEEGLVIDFGVEISLDKLNAFLDKWNLRNGEHNGYSEAEQALIRDEQPMEISFRSILTCNGNILRSSSRCSLSWIPSSCHLGECNPIEARRFLSHYGLETDKAWVLWRCSYRWNTQKESKLDSMNLAMMREAKRIVGQSFSCPEEETSVEVANPISGETYRLNVHEITRSEIQRPAFHNSDLEYPTHYLMMTYTMEPDIANRFFSLRDCSHGDSPRQKHPDPNALEATMYSAASVGIIGGADGPTALIFGSPQTNQENHHAACSALHFDAVGEVEWSPVFQVKTVEDIQVTVL